jgi:predicted phosphodiesterase
MMRVAVIADIHGNLTALEAVLADVAAQRADQVVCLGDVAATGPQPREVVSRLRDLGCPVVRGNTDADAVRPVRLSPLDEEAHRYFDIDRWTSAQLSPKDLAYLRTFQITITLPLGDDATLLCFHGSPRSNTADIFATTPDPVLARMLDGYAATVMAGGHTHTPFVRRLRQLLFLNPGSVGQPFEATASGIRHLPWAEYAIVEREDSARLSVELRRVPIDADRVLQSVLQSGMPHAEWLASRWR